jgi:hypothetical protein
MKAITTVATALAVLAIPSSALAQPAGTVCSTKASQAGKCFSIADTDYHREIGYGFAAWSYLHTSTGAVSWYTPNGPCVYIYASKDQWISYGSPRGTDICVKVPTTLTAHMYERYMFNIPGQDYESGKPVAPIEILNVSQYFADGVMVKQDAVIDYRTLPGNATLTQYCNYYRQMDSNGGPTRYAQDATPQDVYDACVSQLKFFDGRWADRTDATTPPKPDAEKPEGPVVVPASAAKCASVGKVAVRSVKVKCASARNVIARYARSLKSPAGWTCVATVTDAGRRARCVKKAGKGRAVARTAVYGIWRPR